jgi:uncharacterized protein YutE (UPF0331/DUF86 family)
LADRAAITRAVADRLREGVGLRNRIAHGYALKSFLAAVGREAGL